MNELILRTELGDFDLQGKEDIVQTFSIFNLESITSRQGEYTNEFILPLTQNNKRIIGYSDFIISTNTTPYRKITIQIIVVGIEWKEGFLEIISVQKEIKARFQSGNSIFYDKIKQISLPDLPWSDFDHTWNLTNAVANSANTTGFVYPIIDYGNAAIGTDIVDIRQVLPSTYAKEPLDRMASYFGYDIEYVTDVSDFDVAILPFSKKNPALSSNAILINSADVSADIAYLALYKVVVNGLGFNEYFLHNFGEPDGSNFFKMKFNQINTVGSSTGFNFADQKFTAATPGTYDFSADIQCDGMPLIVLNFNNNFEEIRDAYFTFKAIAFVNGNEVASYVLATSFQSGVVGIGNTVISGSGTYNLLLTTVTGSVYLNSGDKFEILGAYEFFGRVIPDDPDQLMIATISIQPIIEAQGGFSNSLNIQLQPALAFNGLITYASLIPNMKCSEYLIDLCIRFGFILNIDEDIKKIYVNKIDSVYDNIINPYDWTDKLDETELPDISFRYNTYAKNNNFLHTEDKTLAFTIDGTNYTMTIDNDNIQETKDLYKSPFAATLYTSYNGTITSTIPTYDSVAGAFTLDISPRICFSEMVINQFKFTDGSTTSTYLTAPRVWFIDPDRNDLSMGFGTNLVNKNLKPIINILQNLKLVKVKINLNILDLLTLDYLKPVYLEQYQTYFFISSINQFNYINKTTTEVELIKLN